MLTGARRTIQTMLLASVASAGALAMLLASRPGFAVHHVFSDPPRHFRIVHTAGNSVTILIGFVTLVACIVALMTRTPRAVVYATLTLIGLLPLCHMESEHATFGMYGIVEAWTNARLVRQAITFICYAPALLGVSFAILYALEHWRRPRTALPTARTIGDFDP